MKAIGKYSIIISILAIVLYYFTYENKGLPSTLPTYYVATKEVNVRKGAGNAYPILFTLKKGDQVEFLSKKNSWYQIKQDGKIGYVNSRYLKPSNQTLSIIKSISQHSVARWVLIILLIIISFHFAFTIYNKVRFHKLLSSVTHIKRGTSSERDLVVELLKYGIPAENIFHDLYIEKYSKQFSQIDLVALTKVGIIVFEVKEYSGWIYGSGHQRKWTQVLNYGKEKYSFYNPIMQNNKHIIDLKKQLQSDYYLPIYSVIVFYGNCVLKEIEFVPHGTFVAKSNRINEVLGKIFSERQSDNYTYEDKYYHMLKEAVLNGEDEGIRLKHVGNIKDMLGEDRIFD